MTSGEPLQLFQSWPTQNQKTGGEPTIHRSFDAIAVTFARLPIVDKLTLTINGYRLATKANTWFNAGVRGFNASPDSLEPLRFQQITDHDGCGEGVRGINAGP